LKTSHKNLFLLPTLIAGLTLALAGRVAAQTLTTLYSFTAGLGSIPNITNNDGAYLRAGLILSGNTLYGTASRGGSSASGTVFAINTDGTGFTNLHSFTATSNSTNDDGANPKGTLFLLGNTLYGTASAGGSSSNGTVFAINTDGTGFTNVHSFTALSNSTNSDGANPDAGVILAGNTLYGAAFYGGSSGNGTVFRVNTDGTGFTNLHSFTAGSGISGSPYTNSDGVYPTGGLILSDNTLYGTASQAGSSGNGTAFAIRTDGTGFAILHNFNHSDGSVPNAGLILSGNTLYGSTKAGGNPNGGTVFALNTDGSGFTTLHSLTFYDGAIPNAALILSGNMLYGTTIIGGSFGSGTVFNLSLPPPQLAIIPSGANVILTWPTNAAGFTLQSTTNLVSPAVWTAVSPVPAVVNSQNTVTNLASDTKRFYRLSQ
jgi:uncharacterized repeat protein (TIGR03803 family)